jgi:hypothetical protein
MQKEKHTLKRTLRNLESDIEAVQQIRRVGRNPNSDLLGTLEVNISVSLNLLDFGDMEDVEKFNELVDQLGEGYGTLKKQI